MFLSVDKEIKNGIENIEERHYRFLIEAEYLDNVYPTSGYRIKVSIKEDVVFVTSIT